MGKCKFITYLNFKNIPRQAREPDLYKMGEVVMGESSVAAFSQYHLTTLKHSVTEPAEVFTFHA